MITTVQRAFAEAMARPPIAADEVRALAAVAEAGGKPCVLPADLIARLEAEARAVLWDVEPVHAAEEREMHFCAARVRCVSVWRPAERLYDWVRRASWRPRATRKPSGWAIEGGWLDEAVPELPTRGVPNAGGVIPVIARCACSEHRDVVLERHRVVVWARPPYMIPSLREGQDVAREIDSLRDFPTPEPPENGVRAGGAWQTARVDAREWPGLELVTRGWCPVLGAGWRATIEEGTDAGWRAMQSAHDGAMRTTDAAWAAERAEIVRAKGEGT